MTLVNGLQQALAVEHAAVYGYGAALAWAARADAEQVERGLGAHVQLRDAITAALYDLGEEPVAAAAGYELPPLDGGTSARRLAADLEHGTLAAMSALIALSGDPADDPAVVTARQLSLDAMASAADRLQALGGDPGALPGVSQREGRRH